MARKNRKGKWKHVRKGVIPQRGMRRHTGNATPSVIWGKWSGTAYTYICKAIKTYEYDLLNYASTDMVKQMIKVLCEYKFKEAFVNITVR